ncbi:MAG: holo-ACP synthase [Thiobacillaceae bacterium]|nr:holo-ACP synthase [Thiobacillaceae bacterium]MDW8324917.1 holo-ACP synthase [Burkholderiales bacterium]
MIHGIGTDIVAIERLRLLHARYGERLAQRLLAGEEQTDYHAAADKVRLLAKRFAAKEALAKALGTGLRPPVSLAHIAVAHDALGRPSFRFATPLAEWLAARGVGRVHLTLADERDYAVGFVVAERSS